MSIETVLTLAVAAAILGAAALLRLVVLGLVRAGFAWKNLQEPSGRHRVPRLDQALPRMRLKERADRITERAGQIAAGAGTLALYLAALVSNAARALNLRVADTYRYQAVGESASTWGGRPHVVHTRT